MYCLAVKFVFLYQIPYLIYTVMAGNENEFGSGFPDLVRLDFTPFQAVFSHLTAHGNSPSTTTAAVIVIPLMLHGSKIFRKIFRQASILFGQAAASYNVAGILYRGRDLYLFLYLYPAIAYIVVK